METKFGEFLKQKRRERSLTQKELSKLLFVSESAVSKWEKNVAYPDINLLPKLSEILGVTEHELITASIDAKTREEKVQAKKWRVFSFSWNLFFYIAYLVALLVCFICNLAVNKTLSWFWIVLSAIVFAFSFTNLPKFIKKHKLLFVPLLEYLSLCLFLAVCCIYVDGNWFWIASLSVLLGLVIIFTPIYIAKFAIFDRIKKYNDFISIAVDFLVLNILLIVINFYTVLQSGWWYFGIALPIVFCIYFIINLLLCVRFLPINKFLKIGIILFLIDLFAYLPPSIIKTSNHNIQRELDDINIFLADLSSWQLNVTLENNIHLIISLSLLFASFIFLIMGIVSALKLKK